MRRGAVAGLNVANLFAGLYVAQSPLVASILGADAPALMRVFLRMHSVGYSLSLVFFSAILLPVLGVLAIRSVPGLTFPSFGRLG